jgi:phosphoenolpyruvate phosphomutase
VNNARKLRELISRPGPIVIVGAHDGLSARLAEEAGFDGVWASGFEISASYGVPDANILSMAESLHAAKMMTDVVSVPVVADCDNGYGNAINVIRCVEEYEKHGVAAICIEDNIFPKRCSFYAGVKRELATTSEHAGKIRAAKHAQRGRDFVVVARTEALIAGWGLDEALERGRAYADAGADMVLVHSKSPTPEEVFAFARRWDRATPLACVPTIYKDTSVSELAEAGFKLVIFANHGLRASIKAMTETLRTLKKEQRAGAVEPHVVPLTRVYEIVGVDRMKKDETQYLPAESPGVTAVVLAAGASERLLPLVADRPKCMLDIKGRSILERQVDVLNGCGVKNIAVVRGYQRQAVDLPNLRYYDNDHWEQSNELSSLALAKKELGSAFLLLYGDLLFESGHLQKLLKSPADITLLVDRSYNDSPRPADARGVPDLVVLENAQEAGYRFVGADQPHKVVEIGRGIDARAAHGEFVGVSMFSDAGARLVRDLMGQLESEHRGRFHEADSLRQATVTDLLQEVIDRGHDVQAIDVYKGWLEVDTFEDYKRAWALIK